MTSMFSAAFDLSQRQTYGKWLVYPSTWRHGKRSVGRELSQTGAMITRRNLNVQPTIKVPVGYKFTVRVNRDILFDSPLSGDAGRSATAGSEQPGTSETHGFHGYGKSAVTRKKTGHLGGGSGVRLFLRLNVDLNERLRALLRYQGELSRYIDEALTGTILIRIMVPCRPGKSTPGLTAVVSTRANSALRSVAQQRGCSITVLANSALQAWLNTPSRSCVVARSR